MLAAYCWPQSAAAGSSIEVMISTGDEGVGRIDRCAIEVVRIGASEEVVARYDDVGVDFQPLPDDVAVEGCGWEPTVTIEVDPAWRSGFHLVRIAAADGGSTEAFFVVRADPATRSEIGPGADAIVVLSTSTWAAYNNWGGPSFYTGGHHSSQQRPLPPGFLSKPDPARYRIARFGDLPRAEVDEFFENHSYWCGAAGWANQEQLFVAWAERNGLTLDYATSLDLHTDPDLLDPYRLYLSVGHDEYWSAAMRDSVEGWVDDGGAAVFFSGNTSFWQIRFEADGTRVVGYKNDFADDPVMGTEVEHTVSTMWSDPLCGRPENEMTGVSFSRGGYAHMRSAPKGSGGYTVWRPDHWVFDGLRRRAGDLLGAEPVVVGYECDGCELALVDGRPVAVPSGGTPANFEVLATAPAHLWETSEAAPGLSDSYIGELNWVAERIGGGDTPANRERFAYGNAVLGTFTRGRGEVFTVGCTDWAYGLVDGRDDGDVSLVTRNVIARHVELGPVPGPAGDG